MNEKLNCKRKGPVVLSMGSTMTYICTNRVHPFKWQILQENSILSSNVNNVVGSAVKSLEFWVRCLVSLQINKLQFSSVIRLYDFQKL